MEELSGFILCNDSRLDFFGQMSACEWIQIFNPFIERMKKQFFPFLPLSIA